MKKLTPDSRRFNVLSILRLPAQMVANGVEHAEVLYASNKGRLTKGESDAKEHARNDRPDEGYSEPATISDQCIGKRD